MEKEFYEEAFRRNRGILGEAGQERIKHSRVAIAGLGGVGGIHATSFARLGVSKFHIADNDIFDVVNINRQAGATKHTLGRSKVDVLEEMILAINPHAEVVKFSNGIDEENIDDFLNDVDVVVDGIDFYVIEARRLLFREARKKGLFVVSAGPVGFGMAGFVVSPKGMSFDKYFNINDKMEESEKSLYFGIGLTPSLLHISYFRPSALNLKGQSAPSLIMGTLAAANFVTTETVKILFNRKTRTLPWTFQYDPFVEKYKRNYLPFGNRGLLQRIKIFFVMRFMKKKGIA